MRSASPSHDKASIKIREWDVEEAEPKPETSRKASTTLKDLFDPAQASGIRERPSWIGVPVAYFVMAAFTSLGIFGISSAMGGGAPPSNAWGFIRIPLATLGGFSVVWSGGIQIASLCKRFFRWGKPLDVRKPGAGHTAEGRREAVFWLFTLGVPAIAVLLLTRNGATQELYHFRGFPQVEDRRFMFYLMLAGLCHWIGFFTKIVQFYLHTWAYRIRFGRLLRGRPVFMASLAKEKDWEYKRRIVDGFLVEWVKRPGKAKVLPYFKHNWRYLTWHPEANPFYDGWRNTYGYPENVLTGKDGARRFGIFDYHSCVDFGFPVFFFYRGLLELNPEDYTVISIKENYELPGLLVYPEELWDKFAKYAGGLDIDMESYEFSEQYRIWSKDRKLAYDVCNGKMMECLMQHPGVGLRIDGTVRSIRFPGLVAVQELPARLEDALTLCDLLPGYLRE